MNVRPTLPSSSFSRRAALTGFGAGALAHALTARGAGAFAQDASPAGTPEVDSEISLDLILSEPVLPAGPIYLWTTMYSILPGTSVEYPGFAIESPVAAAVWVQSGLLAITGEHGAVHVESAAPPNASPVPGELLLGPGDAVALELGPNHSYQMRSAGSDPLVFAEFWLIGGPRASFPDPPGYQILDFYHDPGAVELETAATATMHLSRMTLAQGEKLAAPQDGWHAVLTENPTHMSRSWPGGVPTNTGADPIPIVVMTADFQPVPGTPSASVRR